MTRLDIYIWTEDQIMLALGEALDRIIPRARRWSVAARPGQRGESEPGWIVGAASRHGPGEIVIWFPASDLSHESPLGLLYERLIGAVLDDVRRSPIVAADWDTPSVGRFLGLVG